ncbi:YerC/YecD family TrpR-related protein [Pseudomarimonas salicorniae]|uniref:YerC/YecD family TrpR-related protein n=1 Tax=Pseudomarimonas salicorniae TaxID=2933270 RepID=A0ABT0GLH6_9GAMM|nr:YerC/YecD family TrpR-related protein [Lysobacter sp. CAU 1642]MCK7595398.1 YerC/YecD family TrpR-related protein [Lysobacter sp. CAU 1642]
MKRRALPHESESRPAVEALASAFAGLGDAASVRAFLADLCTPAEIEAMADRWAVIPLLLAGQSYRDIHDATGVSVTTIGRVARCLAEGRGYRLAAERMGWDCERLSDSADPAPPSRA